MSTVKVPESALNTPMLRQFMAIKKDYQDAILFFRLGDFYEMFLDDALIASKELDLTLTGRGKEENRVPMCGVPHHASENYISRLVDRGFKVALCEQVEDPNESKGITRREVVQVITPGTVISHDVLDAQHNNYLVGIMKLQDQFGVSFVDITTGEFRLFSCEDELSLNAYLDRLSPKEVLLEEGLELELEDKILVNTVSLLVPKRATEEIETHFRIKDISAFGIDRFVEVTPIAWALLDYVKKTQQNALPQITQCLPFLTQNTMMIDKVSSRNLELIHSTHTREKAGSLFWVLDTTKTAMGARKLKQLILNPSLDMQQIEQRLDAVQVLMGDVLSREEIRDVLNSVYDLERLVSRIVSDHHNPKDCIALKQSLAVLGELPGILSHLDGAARLKQYADYFASFNNENSPFKTLCDTIETGIEESPPTTLRDGKVIKPGFSPELDELNESFRSIRNWIDTLEEKEREATGIKGLKVGFNKVFGYYFNVPNSNTTEIPEHYIRKQTLANAERYITPELKEKENILLNGEEKRIALESETYLTIVELIKSHIGSLQELADVVAQLDCLQSFSTVSQRYNYCRPSFDADENLTLDLTDSRHPVLQKSDGGSVIPNSISLSKESELFVLITGPNMAGKSTLMRQIALTVIMAQIGCFVPASSAKLSLFDKLFTRIGALDNLYSGQSTFMVEMLETATILHNATPRSLILLDEIGRGTSTYDGMSIAGAITEHIHHHIGARTFFATHYHELTELCKTLPQLGNYSMAITEDAGKISFTYTLKKGAADKSYGVHVAEMAGLPSSVIDRANDLLSKFESGQATELNPNTQISLF